jgi:hypothetical protein
MKKGHHDSSLVIMTYYCLVATAEMEMGAIDMGTVEGAVVLGGK